MARRWAIQQSGRGPGTMGRSTSLTLLAVAGLCLAITNHVYAEADLRSVVLPSAAASAADDRVVVPIAADPAAATGEDLPALKPQSALNLRPVIGVLAQDYYGPVAGKSSFIAASYVKWLEGGGARVMPIFLNQTDAYYDAVLDEVSGVLFPGGAVYIDQDTGYGLTGRRLYEKILKKNQKSRLPLWGTCLGMELALYAQLNGFDPRTRCSSQDEARPLHFTGIKGRLFGAAPPTILKKLATENVTINYHSWCITPESMAKTGLAKHFSTLAMNVDNADLQFVSALEHKTYPIYLVQFHPEKVQYEWVHNLKHKNIPHSASAVSVSQYMAEFFVAECRASPQRFSEENQNRLIYAHPVTNSGEHSIYVQQYLFD